MGLGVASEHREKGVVGVQKPGEREGYFCVVECSTELEMKLMMTCEAVGRRRWRLDA